MLFKIKKFVLFFQSSIYIYYFFTVYMFVLICSESNGEIIIGICVYLLDVDRMTIS